MKSIFTLFAILFSVSSSMASTAYYYDSNKSYAIAKIEGVKLLPADSASPAAVEIEVANTQQGQSNFLKFDKKLLANANMDTASFIQLVMNKNLNVVVFCTDISHEAGLYYTCKSISLTVDYSSMQK